MKRVLLVTILTLSIGPRVSSRTVRSVRALADEEQVQVTRNLQLLSAHVSAEAAADSVAVWLADQGYLAATANVLGDTLVVDPGARSILETVRLSNDTTVAARPRVPFTRTAVEAALGPLLDRSRSTGHYYARASVDSISRSGTNLNLTVLLNQGPAVQLAGERFNGLTRSRPDLIGRFVRSARGSPLTDETIARAEQDAATIPFLNFEPPAMISPRPGYEQADLVLAFAEKQQFRFSGGAGYLPDNSTGLVWNLDLVLRNLFGDGRQIALQSERRESGRTVLSVQYAQPSFLLGVGSLNAAISTRDYRDQFYEFALSLEHTSRLTRHFEIGAGVAWRRVEPAHAGLGYSSSTAQISGKHTTSGHDGNTGDGITLKWNVAYSNRRYHAETLASPISSAIFNETRADVGLESTQHLSSRLVSFLHLRYQGLETSEREPPLAELYLVGGPRTLRGFRNDQFAAQRVALATIEPRLGAARSYLFLFYDAAYINRSTGTAGIAAASDLYRNGYGAGFSFADKTRTLRLSFGWNPEVTFSDPRLAVEFSSGF